MVSKISNGQTVQKSKLFADVSIINI